VHNDVIRNDNHEGNLRKINWTKK